MARRPNDGSRTSAHPAEGLLASMLVAAAWLAAAVSEMLASPDDYAPTNLLRTVLGRTSLAGTPVMWDVLGYGAALVAIYLSVGAMGWLLGRATHLAVPGMRVRQRWLAGAWSLLLFAWADAANAVLFPWAASAGGWSGLARLGIGSVTAFDLLTTLALLVGGYVSLRAAAVSRLYARHGARLFVYPLLLVGAVLTWSVHKAFAVPQFGSDPGKPHVIIVGVDSLRPDSVGMSGGIGLTPNLDAFLQEAQHFNDTTTPLARTFAAWVAILTGRHPVATGARENLIPREKLDADETLAVALRRSGYRTVYATDEVRFSNIDESFGFDEVVGPAMGASDFVIGSVNDTPLSNLLVNTSIGRWLFPNLHANRAAAITYRPETFVDTVAAAVDFEQPTLLAVHLTLPHWPFHWADDYEGSVAESMRQPYTYSAALIEADRQFGSLMGELERKGALQNAILVVLSDHGEALGLPADNLLRATENRAATRGIPVSIWGHGTSVLSPVQYQVMLAWRGYGSASFPARQGTIAAPASLEDVTPTVLDLLGMPVRTRLDGMSLAGLLTGRAGAQQEFAGRLRFTETGITVGFTAEGEVELEEMIREGLKVYSVNAETGRIEMRAEYAPRLLAAKEKAVLAGNRLMATVPVAGGNRLVVVDRDGRDARVLDEPPSTDDPQLQAMWHALQQRFPGEVALAPRVSATERKQGSGDGNG